jgi:hypothetical protein
MDEEVRLISFHYTRVPRGLDYLILCCGMANQLEIENAGAKA